MWLRGEHEEHSGTPLPVCRVAVAYFSSLHRTPPIPGRCGDIENIENIESRTILAVSPIWFRSALRGMRWRMFLIPNEASANLKIISGAG